MKNAILLLSISSLFISSCGGSGDYVASYSNDVDVSVAWTEDSNPSIKMVEDARSGVYVCRLDSASPFSTTFDIKFSEVSNKDFNSIKFSAWIKAGSDQAKPSLVVDIRDEAGNTVELLSKKIEGVDFKINNEWNQYEFDVKLTEKNRKNKTNSYRIYVINSNKTPVLVDDLRVDFN
jgi:hypothetical protein